MTHTGLRGALHVAVTLSTLFGTVPLAVQKMAYSIQAILAKAGVLAPLPHLKIVNLKHGIDMVPLATPAQKHFGIPFCPLTDDEHAELPQALAELCRQFSRHGTIAYIEAEIFG